MHTGWVNHYFKDLAGWGFRWYAVRQFSFSGLESILQGATEIKFYTLQTPCIAHIRPQCFMCTQTQLKLNWGACYFVQFNKWDLLIRFKILEGLNYCSEGPKYSSGDKPKGLDGVTTNRSERHKEKEYDGALNSDFTSSAVISSSKSTVLSLPIWNILPPSDCYRQHRH